MNSDLSRIVNALPGLIWTALPDGKIDFLNQRWCEYTGLVAREALADGWRIAIHPEDLPRLLDEWRSIVAGHDDAEMEGRLRRCDGSYRWFLFRVCPLIDASGQIVKWCGINFDIDDRKRADAALRENERRFHGIFDGLPALVSVMTPEGELEHANRHYLDYFGATVEELNDRRSGRGTTHSCHPGDRSAVFAAYKESLDTGQPYDLEGRRRRADGVYRWFRSRGFPLRDTSGRINFWYFLQIDVDDARRAEALLSGEKQLLEMVAGGRPLPVILEALCRFFEDTAGGCHCSVVLIDSSGAYLESGVAPNLPAAFITAIIGRPVNVDSGPCAMAACLNEPVIAADLTSETRWADYAWSRMALMYGVRACWSTPISSTAGRVLGAFAIYYDQPKTPTSLDQGLIEQFTHIAGIAIERSHGEAALRRSEAFLAQAQRLSSTGSFSWRTTTDAINWSAELYRIFEFDPARPVTLELIRTRVHPDDLPSLQEMLERARSGAGDFEYEHRLDMPDSSVRYLHMVAHETRDQDGRLEYVGAIQDVTERRLADETLAKVRSELAHVARVTTLGALTASIAHEVNQPLSGIITNASTCLRMLATDPPNVDGARETARRTIRDGNRASDVVTRLRALFAKGDATTESLDLNEAAREVIALSSSDLQRARVILRAELADNLPPVTGDRVQLQQVILNLLLNASDAMTSVNDRPRQLVIRTEQDESDGVRLAVQDTGVGIESEGADRLFDAFYTTKSGGMGIGLSVSRSIIEKHHGRLWATANKGPGATFSFAIPAAVG